jgi:UDP-2,4-diacetamido-2,4,6-trideoxy-beta-L-altropyranose hydrolase
MKKIFFRIDCSNEVGIGHLNRAKAIIDQINSHHVDLYVYGNITEDFKTLFRSVYLLTSKNFLNHDFNDQYDVGFFDFSTKNTFSQKTNDITQYFQKAKINCRRLVLIDGLGNDSLIKLKKDFPVDDVIIPYAGAPQNEAFHFKYHAGPQYFIFPQEINHLTSPSPNDRVSNILITMGGSDPMEMTLAVIDVVLALGNPQQFKIDIAVGPLFNSSLISKISKKIKSHENFKIVDAKNSLAPFMDKKDFCFSASGLTKYELAKVGIPCALLSHHETSWRNNSSFNDLGTSFDLGLFTEFNLKKATLQIADLFQNTEKRKRMYSNTKNIFNSNSIKQLFADLGV